MQRGKAKDKGNGLSTVNRKEEEAVAGDEKDESHSMLKFLPSIEDSDVPRSQQPI
jgi:hypothetical protein